MIEEKAKKIKVLILDVDGVMTDGRIVLGNDNDELKFFDVKDGHGISLALRAGLKVILLTGRKSNVVNRRAEELKITEIYQGVYNKIEVFQKILSNNRVSNEEVAYIGDDLVDLPILREVGFSAAVADAVDEVKKDVDYITKAQGGRGAVREVIELLLKVQSKWEEVVKRYM